MGDIVGPDRVYIRKMQNAIYEHSQIRIDLYECFSAPILVLKNKVCKWEYSSFQV